MKVLLLVVGLAAVSGPALAINKCVGPEGRVVYTDAPCAGAGERLDSRLGGNTIEAGPRLRDLPGPAPAAPPAAAARASCPSEQDIRNIEAAGTSIRMDRYEREVSREQLRRARACEPLMTDGQKQAMKVTLQQAAAASRPPPPPPPTQTALPSEDRLQNCVYGNCGSRSGATYRVDPLTNGIRRRDDGAPCTRLATGEVRCNP